MVQIAVMGHGTVGSGVLEVFYKNKQSIERKANKEMEVKYVLELRDFPGLPYSDKFVKDFEVIVADPEIGVVVEVMGGLEPAFTFVRRCLEAGKSVVTSNKELVAARGAQLLQIANEHDVNFFFEASVGGGIPIIRPLHSCLAANEIDEVAGILNGTTNFILTKMIREHATFEEALATAQELGYAERNPAADVEGTDACRKICILASLAFGRHIYPEEVYTQGITGVKLEDVEYAKIWGGVIKLIAFAKRLPDGKAAAMVCPAFISSASQLSSVDDVFNAVLVRGDATGDVVFYGRGAGKLPTASAVVADVVDAVKAEHSSTSLRWEDSPGHDTVTDYRANAVRMYVRVGYDNLDKALSDIGKVFGAVAPMYRTGVDDELAFIAPELTEREFAEKLEQLGRGLLVLGALRVLDY